MAQNEQSILAQLLGWHQGEILKDWVAEQARARGESKGGVKQQDLERQSAEFLSALQEACQRGASDDIDADHWARARDILSDISTEQNRQGATPVQIATFVFSLKQILFRV